MFQFRRFPSYTYWFSIWYPKVGFPIRKSPDQSSFATPRSLSQLITSFIGSWCQGIPLALLLAWPSGQPNSRKVQFVWFSSYVELCRLISRFFCLAKIVIFTLWHFIKTSPKFPLLLPSHNCIIIHNVQFSRYITEFLLRNSMKSHISMGFQSIP